MLFRHIPITPQFLRVRSLNLPHFFLFPENMMFQARGSEARLSEAGRRKPSQLMVFNGKPPTVAGFGSGVSMPPCGFTASSHRFQHELGRTQEGTGRVWACKDHVEIAGVVQPSFYAPANGERLCLPIPSPKAKRTGDKNQKCSEIWRNPFYMLQLYLQDSNAFETIMFVHPLFFCAEEQEHE